MNYSYLYIPSCFYINILQNYNGIYIYIYSKDHYVILNITNSVETNIADCLLVNKHTNNILLKVYKSDNKLKTLCSNFHYFFLSLEYIFYKKLKFSGKGFKIKKKKNNIILYFNTAHINLILIKNNITLKLSKNKYIIFSNNKQYNYIDSYLFKSVKLNNIFTKRGLRFSRQLILKKKGKN